MDLGSGEGHTGLHFLRLGLRCRSAAVDVCVRLRLIGNTHGVVVLQPGSLSVGVAGQTQLGIGINFADGGQSLVAGVREIGVAALPVVEPLRLNRGTSFWNEGSCLPDGDHCHGV